MFYFKNFVSKHFEKKRFLALALLTLDFGTNKKNINCQQQCSNFQTWKVFNCWIKCLGGPHMGVAQVEARGRRRLPSKNPNQALYARWNSRDDTCSMNRNSCTLTNICKYTKSSCIANIFHEELDSSFHFVCSPLVNIECFWLTQQARSLDGICRN